MHTKAIISNKFVEVIHQSYSPLTKRTSSGGRRTYPTQNSEQLEKNNRVGINRARKQIRRLLECNFIEKYSFLTLTFSDTQEMDIQDIDTCHKMFNKFKKRLDYYLKVNELPKFKYLGVTEFQDECRQGIVHFHILCNLTGVSTTILAELWKHGLIHKKDTKADVTQNTKVSYYLKKGIWDQRLAGRKKYFRSQDLKQPITIDIQEPSELYECLNKCNPTLLEGNTFDNPFTGETKYENYYLENSKELMNYVQEL